jgi:hypothetical protein
MVKLPKIIHWGSNKSKQNDVFIEFEITPVGKNGVI